jgi:RNA polymerase primary sigma factor
MKAKLVTTPPRVRVHESIERNIMASYLNALHRFSQLKHLELVELFQNYRAGRTELTEDTYDLTAEAKRIRAKLIECNLRLVVSIAKQYKGHNIPLEDLIQEGNIGLMKSIDRFEWEKGFKFSTYATWWIRQSIGQHLLKRRRLIRLPAHAVSLQKKMMHAAEVYRTSNNEEPSSEELMDIVGASETVARATIHSGRGIVSLNTPSFDRSGGSEGNSLEDKIEDERPGVNPFENVAEKQLLSVTKRVLDSLSSKEAAILRLRFGLVEDLTTDTSAFPITEIELKSVMHGKGMT